MKEKTALENIFDHLVWGRKFQLFPDHDTTIKHVWRTGEEDEATMYLKKHKEETSRKIRSAWLFTDSLGQAIAITEDPTE